MQLPPPSSPGPRPNPWAAHAAAAGLAAAAAGLWLLAGPLLGGGPPLAWFLAPAVYAAYLAGARAWAAPARRAAARDRAAEARARLAAIVESSDDAIVSMTLGGVVQTWNAGAERLFGYAAAEAVGRHISLVIPPERRDEEELILGRVRRGERVHHFETVRVAKDGRRVNVSLTVSPVRDETGAITGASKVARDVTERKRAEHARRETEERLRVALRGAGGGAWDWDPGTGAAWWSDEMYDLWGVPPGTPVGPDSVTATVHPADRDAVRRRAAEAVERGAAYHHEFRLLHPTRGERWVASHGQVVRGGDGGGPPRLIGISLDVTDRRAAEGAVRLRDRAIRAVTQGILVTDPTLPDNPVTFASPGFERMTGYPAAETVGRNCRFLQGQDTDPAAVARVRAAVAAGEPCTVELLNYRKDGSTFWNELSVSPVRDDAGRLTHFVGVQTDVTERRGLEARYRQAQKMEAVGQLAGGVAHDFNNLLTVINGYSEMVQAMLAPADPVRAMVAEVRHAGERAADLTSQLLAFSRQAVLEPRVVAPNRLVAETGKMLKRLIGEDVALVTTLDPHAGRVRVDPGQFGQVLMNLAVNARDAMPTGGRLTIETHAADLDAAYAAAHPDARPGRYVLVAVSDTGTGMTDAVKARVFEPFFTTKEVGRGTGLGLSTVYGIVRQSGGFVEVYSEVGVGTTFKVYLPAADGAAEDAAAEAAPARGGTEVVLLVEDQSDVRRFARVALESYGYTVVEAADGPAALAAAARPGPPVDLLVADVVMPGMSGRQVAEALRAGRPGLRVLYVSGYTDDAVVRHGILQADVAFLRKPFTPLALARKVREVLDRPPPAAGQ